MNKAQYNSVKSYLISKKVSFAEKVIYNEKGEGTLLGFVGITITKEDQFFRANGKVISGNMAKLLM